MEEQKSRLKIGAKLLTIIAVAFSIFQLYTGGLAPLPSMQQRLIHLTLGLMMIFLVFPLSKNKKTIGTIIIDVIAFGLSCAAGVYLLLNEDRIAFSLGNASTWDLVAGGIVLILVLEGTRRAMGWALPAIATISILYAAFGDKLIGNNPSGYDMVRIISHLSLTTEGIFGIPLGASATVVAMFIIFAAFLNGTGSGQYFTDIAMSIFGRAKGGAAKAAAISSMLMGMLTGSVIANVMSTGTFTIPLMKKSGYKPQTAGAIEAVSSTGGQIMPPVMGAAAYIIAEFLRVPFVEIMKAAIVPALLYYFALYIFIDLEARKSGLSGLPKESILAHREQAKGRGYLVLPIIVLLFLMIVLNWSPQKSAFFSIALTLVFGLIQVRDRVNWSKLVVILQDGARGTLEVLSATACAGIIIGVMSLTGLGLQLSTILVELSGGKLLLLLGLTMVASLILGMGLTTTACYVILAVLVAPALVKMNVLPIAAHFFVFFFGMYSFITPPVALGAYAAASVAGSRSFPTGFEAWKIALPGFILPYMFVLSPTILLIGPTSQIITDVASACIGVSFITTSVCGYFTRTLNYVERGVMLAAGILLMFPNIITSLIGLVIGGLLLGSIYLFNRKNKTQESSFVLNK